MTDIRFVKGLKQVMWKQFALPLGIVLLFPFFSHLGFSETGGLVDTSFCFSEAISSRTTNRVRNTSTLNEIFKLKGSTPQI